MFMQNILGRERVLRGLYETVEGQKSRLAAGSMLIHRCIQVLGVYCQPAHVVVSTFRNVEDRRGQGRDL